MTTAIFAPYGVPRIIGLKPTNTSAATIYTAGEKGGTLLQVYLANLTGSAVNATIAWGDGTTDYSLVDTFPVAARDYYSLDFNVPLLSGHTIKVTSGTSNGMTFNAVVLENVGSIGERRSA